jgi:hypothetical protein
VFVLNRYLISVFLPFQKKRSAASNDFFINDAEYVNPTMVDIMANPKNTQEKRSRHILDTGLVGTISLINAMEKPRNTVDNDRIDLSIVCAFDISLGS